MFLPLHPTRVAETKGWVSSVGKAVQGLEFSLRCQKGERPQPLGGPPGGAYQSPLSDHTPTFLSERNVALPQPTPTLLSTPTVLYTCGSAGQRVGRGEQWGKNGNNSKNWNNKEKKCAAPLTKGTVCSQQCYCIATTWKRQGVCAASTRLYFLF